MKYTRKEKAYLIAIGILMLAIVAVALVSFYLPRGGSMIAQTVRPTEHDSRVVIREVEKLTEVEKEITGDIIQDGLKDMGMLVTQEYYFTEVVGFSSVKKFLKTDIKMPFTESSFLASYDGVITAGIDFSGITARKDEETKRITIRIPAATVQNVDIDPNSFTLHSEKYGLSNPISASDFNRSLIELENTARQKALERGLLEGANENGRRVVKRFVSSLVGTGVYTLEFITV